MFRMIRWMAPIVALAFVMPVISRVHAADDAKTGTVAGVVKDTDGKVVAGAHVSLSLPEPKDGDKPKSTAADDGGKPKHPKPLAEATTDGDGKYTLPNIAPGEYIVHAKLKGKGVARETVTVEAGKTATVDLALKPMDHAKQAPSDGTK